jgi:hypothetical protein
LGLRRNVPELKIQADDRTAQGWIELSSITTEGGCFLELSVFRWVKVMDSGEEIFTKVWWNQRTGFGETTREHLKEFIDILLTSFAADYYRAQSEAEKK